MIRINKLNKFFNKGRQNEIHVIDNVTVDLPEKGITAIFGKSGCGKTTLLNVIGGLDGFSGGSVFVEDEDIRKAPDIIRNKYMGYVFQNYNLNMERSCFDNVADALRLCGMRDDKEIEERVDAALKNVGMQDYKSRLPSTLSGGQQQRIAIARAIVKNPKIILADEPTGNLDEENTVMIMELLKRISRDHLVLLVTHEQDLVSYYCDTVIELSDGKIISVTNNSTEEGYIAKEKNKIYLGDLEKSITENSLVSVEYYGEAPSEPIKIRVVNSLGRLFVRIDTKSAELLDEQSEIRLSEEKYEEKKSVAYSENIDMSRLTRVEGSHFGRLFSFKSSVVSGYNANFKSVRNVKKTLKRCMALFASVLVVMSAVFGTSIQDIIKARESYNHNVFYVYAKQGDNALSEKVYNSSLAKENGIDGVNLSLGKPYGDMTLSFLSGFFESFNTGYYDNSFKAKAAVLDTSLAKGKEVLAGKSNALSPEEIIITSRVADELLEKSSLGYISDYKDLIGLITTSFNIGGKNLRVAGIVRSEETAVYLPEMTMAKYVLGASGISALPASEYGISLSKGECVYVWRTEKTQKSAVAVGGKVLIAGEDLTVKDVVKRQNDYHIWLLERYPECADSEKFLVELAQTEKPDMKIYKDGTSHYTDEFEKFRADNEFTFFDVYYSHIGEFIYEYYMTNEGSFEAWLYVEKGIEEAKFLFITAEDFYKAVKYKEMTGRYPTREELDVVADSLPDFKSTAEGGFMIYQEEFFKGAGYDNSNVYLVSDEDYIAFSKRMGDTDESAVKPYGAYVDEYCTVIHSFDTDKTEAFLRASVSAGALITPDDIFSEIIEENLSDIVNGVVTMAVILLVMSVCMYFIMRSSLISRIKEIGIYRVIGVSRKNLIFRFTIETLVLTTLTVFWGYLLTSTFMYACLSISPLVSTILFYPPWYALILLAVMYVICTVCGLIPIMLLLRKTPSEILAKYDI